METRLLNDHRFFTLSEADQLLFMKLLLISRSTNNKIPKEVKVLKALLRSNRNENDIISGIERLLSKFSKFRQDKYKYYFSGYDLRFGNKAPKLHQNGTPDEDEDIDKDKEEDKEEKFIASLKNNNAFKQIDIARELGKMDAWLSTRPGRKKTRRFIVNWLNKIEAPIKPIRRTRPDE